MRDPSRDERLAALKRLEVTDTPSRPLVDSLTNLASQTFHAAAGLISLVNHPRQNSRAALASLSITKGAGQSIVPTPCDQPGEGLCTIWSGVSALPALEGQEFTI